MMLHVLDLFSGYTIDEAGEIRSRFGRVMKPHLSSNGYSRIELSGKKYLLHRLLAIGFIPNPNEKPHVNHIDGNKTNNRLSNLEWVSQSENQIHAYKIGLQIGFRKSVPLSESHVLALCGSRWNYEHHSYNLGKDIFNNLWDASAHFNISRQTVLNRCKSPKWPTWSKTVERR